MTESVSYKLRKVTKKAVFRQYNSKLLDIYHFSACCEKLQADQLLSTVLWQRTQKVSSFSVFLLQASFDFFKQKEKFRCGWKFLFSLFVVS